MKNIIENNFFNVCMEIGVSSSIKNSKFQLQQIFNGIILENKNILDVGGGSGYLSFYCKINGGRHVVCLEPEDEGSNNEKNNSFEVLNDRIDYDIDYLDKRIEDYNTKKKFDLIILHNSINHLVDGNTKELSTNDISNIKMMNTIEKISSLALDDCLLLIVDNSGYHFFQKLGFERHPLIPHVGFHDHESPDFWTSYFKEFGFKFKKVDWITPNPMRHFGKVLLNNSYSSYFFGLPFRLVLARERIL